MFVNDNEKILYKKSWKKGNYNLNTIISKQNNILFVEISLKDDKMRIDSIMVLKYDKESYQRLETFINNFPAYFNSEISYLREFPNSKSYIAEDITKESDIKLDLYTIAFLNVIDFYKKHI